MSNEYYVYLHRRATDNKVFYVGKGKGYRYKARSGRNRYWSNIYKKHGLVVELVFENLTEVEAFELEIETIKEMRYHFEETLCNMTDGGEGVSGYRWENMQNHPCLKNIGRKQSKEEIESRASKLRGRKRSHETVLKIVKAVRKAKSGSLAFTHMKRLLTNRCIFSARDFNRLPNINRKEFYAEADVSNNRWPQSAIMKSVTARKGKPSYNSDMTEYSFINTVSGEIVEITKRDLAMIINKEKLLHTISQITRVVNGIRLSAYGWKLYKKEENE